MKNQKFFIAILLIIFSFSFMACSKSSKGANSSSVEGPSSSSSSDSLMISVTGIPDGNDGLNLQLILLESYNSDDYIAYAHGEIKNNRADMFLYDCDDYLPWTKLGKYYIRMNLPDRELTPSTEYNLSKTGNTIEYKTSSSPSFVESSASTTTDTKSISGRVPENKVIITNVGNLVKQGNFITGEVFPDEVLLGRCSLGLLVNGHSRKAYISGNLITLYALRTDNVEDYSTFPRISIGGKYIIQQFSLRLREEDAEGNTITYYSNPKDIEIIDGTATVDLASDMTRFVQ